MEIKQKRTEQETKLVNAIASVIADIFEEKRGEKTKTAFADEMNLSFCTYKTDILGRKRDTHISTLYQRCKLLDMDFYIVMNGVKINIKEIEKNL